jgi:hypothetical protein
VGRRTLSRSSLVQAAQDSADGGRTPGRVEELHRYTSEEILMKSTFAVIATLAAAGALALADGSALAQPKGKDKEQKEQRDPGKGGDRDKKPKKAKHQNGKQLAGEKLKKEGKHELHKNGKHTAFIEVKGGKVAGISVKHAEKGDAPVKKYKTTKNPMTTAAVSSGFQVVAFVPVQQVVGETWIGYAYIDDWGDEVIYWFPYDIVYDPWTGTTEYVPAY